ADRYPSAAAFAAALMAPRREGSSRKRGWRFPGFLVGGLVGVLLLATAGLWWWLALSAPEPEPREPPEPAPRSVPELRRESPRPVAVRPGRSVKVPLRILRVNGIRGAVVMEVRGAPAGVTLTLPRDSDEGQAELRVAAGTTPGRHTLRLLARA